MELLLIRFIVDLVFLAVLIWGIYYRVNKNTEYIFNFVIFNLLIFFIASLLSQSNIETGFAFGIFAILSIIRYRTEPIPIKEMTFLFISIILAIINSTVSSALGYGQIIFANIVIILVTLVLENAWLKNFKPCKEIIFEDIKLIHADRREDLIKELNARTGYDIADIKIDKIDYLKDVAYLRVYIN